METSSRAPERPGRGERGVMAELVNDRSSRKRFLRMVGGAGSAGAFGTLVAACGERDTPIGITQRDPGTIAAFGPGDTGIVNYALFLEYLEGDFYDRVLRGDEIRDERVREAFRQVRSNEVEHRRVLKELAEQIGRPIQRPRTDFDAILDGGQERVIDFAATLENLGAAAYLGQVPRISDSEVLVAALSVHTVEARHAAVLNELAGRGFSGREPLRGSIPNGAFARPMSMEQVIAVARPYFVGSIPPLQQPGA